MPTPSALPPQSAIPVESPLVDRLYATRAWSETEALLDDGFVLHVGGKRRRAKHLKNFQQTAEASFDDLNATVEEVLADLQEPTVLYVLDTTRGRPRYRHRDEPDLNLKVWTRVVVTPCGTRIRELGPSVVIDE
jgi:hypothetical protein